MICDKREKILQRKTETDNKEILIFEINSLSSLVVPLFLISLNSLHYTVILYDELFIVDGIVKYIYREIDQYVL